MSIFPGPTPPYTNPPIEPQYFQPWAFQISGITLGQTTTVTMVIPSITSQNYVVGQEVRLIIPKGYGATQLNGVTGFVISIPSSTQVTLDIVSTRGNAFINAGTGTPAQILTIGDLNFGIISSTGRIVPSTNIPGAFINISPN